MVNQFIPTPPSVNSLVTIVAIRRLLLHMPVSRSALYSPTYVYYELLASSRLYWSDFKREMLTSPAIIRNVPCFSFNFDV